MDQSIDQSLLFSVIYWTLKRGQSSDQLLLLSVGDGPCKETRHQNSHSYSQWSMYIVEEHSGYQLLRLPDTPVTSDSIYQWLRLPVTPVTLSLILLWTTLSLILLWTVEGWWWPVTPVTSHSVLPVTSHSGYQSLRLPVSSVTSHSGYQSFWLLLRLRTDVTGWGNWSNLLLQVSFSYELTRLPVTPVTPILILLWTILILLSKIICNINPILVTSGHICNSWSYW